MEINNLQAGSPASSCSPVEWYAIRVRSKCERSVAMGLDGKGYQQFLPLCHEYRNWAQRMRRVERILIPGYVFAQFDPRKRLPVLTIPGVSHIVGTRNGPIPVATEELASLRLIAQSGSTAVPWPFDSVGQRVIVVGGPLRGLRGFLAEVKNQSRVVVRVTLLKRSVAAEVDRTCVQSASSFAAADSTSFLRAACGSPA